MEKIEPKYVTFDQAKQLKEKLFDIPCVYYWFENGITSVPTRMFDNRVENWNKYPTNLRISAPEFWDVVEWLRVTHGIWIMVNFANKTQWYFDCNKFGNDGKEKKLFQSNYNFNSPKEAYSAAFDYVLKELI
jgi:hypothetical protein